MVEEPAQAASSTAEGGSGLRGRDGTRFPFWEQIYAGKDAPSSAKEKFLPKRIGVRRFSCRYCPPGAAMLKGCSLSATAPLLASRNR